VDLPASLAGIEVATIHPAGLGDVGIVIDHATAAATFVVELGSSSFLLASASEQGRVLDQWGRVLGAAVETGQTSIRHVSCTLISSQGSLTEHQAFVEQASGSTGPSRPVQEYGRLIQRGTAATSSHRILFSVTVEGRARAGGWGFDEATAAGGGARSDRRPPSARELGHREVARAAVSAMHDLRSVGWSEQRLLSERELWELLGHCVDPDTRSGRAAQAERGIEAVLVPPGPAGPPTSVTEHREWVTINGVTHRSYWVRSWPNYGLRPDWMIRLLSEVVGERRFTVFFRPIPRSASVRTYERDMARHDAATIAASEKGKRVPFATRRAQQSIEGLGEDLMAGYPEVELCALATVSAPDPAALRHRCDAFASLAVANGLELSPLRDAQELGWRDSTPFGFCPLKPRSAWS
jgi:hypothetical protein